jgi:hypothetical protein
MVVVVLVESAVVVEAAVLWSVELFDPQAASNNILETGTAKRTERRGLVITETGFKKDEKMSLTRRN